MKSSEIVNKISEIVDKETPQPHIEFVNKDTTEINDKKSLAKLKSEIVNKISESESTGLVKDIAVGGCLTDR